MMNPLWMIARENHRINIQPLLDYLVGSGAGYAWELRRWTNTVASGSGGDAVKGSLAFTEDTMFNVQSVSKLVAEAALRVMVRKTSLQWTDTVDDLLSGSFTVGSGFNNVNLTYLVRMRSGANAGFSGVNGSLATWLAAGSGGPTSFRQYNNGNYAAIDRIIADEAGTSFAQYADSEVLTPLGISGHSWNVSNAEPQMYEYGESTAGQGHFAVAYDAVSGLVIPLKEMAKLSRLLRTDDVLTEQERDDMIHADASMESMEGPKGPVFWRTGTQWSTSTNVGIRAMFMRLTDGYDLVWVNNTRGDGPTLRAASAGVVQ